MESSNSSQCTRTGGTFGPCTGVTLDDPEFTIRNFPVTIDAYLTRPLRDNIVTGSADTLRFYRTFQTMDDATLDEECVGEIMECLECSVERHGETVVRLAFQDFLWSGIFVEMKGDVKESRSAACLVSRLDAELLRSELQDPLRQGWRDELPPACQMFADRVFAGFAVRSLLPIQRHTYLTMFLHY